MMIDQRKIDFRLLEGSLEEGIILANKPRWWSSFDIIRAFRRQTGVKKVGHAGTLDPLATGTLILCSGKMTKRISELQEKPKTYEMLACLGATTPSLDAEFEPIELQDCSKIGQEELEAKIKQVFLGKIEQAPPAYSAVKIGGRRAYELARNGVKVKTMSKQVEIFEFEILDFKHLSESIFWEFHEHCKQSPDPLQEIIQTRVLYDSERKLIIFRAKIVCSKGTYIRSLAQDLAISLGTQGYLIGLRRV